MSQEQLIKEFIFSLSYRRKIQALEKLLQQMNIKCIDVIDDNERILRIEVNANNCCVEKVYCSYAIRMCGSKLADINISYYDVDLIAIFKYLTGYNTLELLIDDFYKEYIKNIKVCKCSIRTSFKILAKKVRNYLRDFYINKIWIHLPKW